MRATADRHADRIESVLAPDWLPALVAAPAGAQQSRTFFIGSRFRSIEPARWRQQAACLLLL
jgi:hypothetical protein